MRSDMRFGPPSPRQEVSLSAAPAPASDSTLLPVEGGFTPDGILAHLKSLLTLQDKLMFLLALMYSFRPYDEFRDDILRYEALLKDMDLMRAINHRDAMVSEFPVEYFGKDYGPDDYFLFQPDIEKVIMEINLDITEVSGRLIRKLSENTLNLTDI